MEDGLVQVRELQRQLQKLRKEQEELEERNEELEALLGETQNTSKEERHRHEGELEGLHRRVMTDFSLSALLCIFKWHKGRRDCSLISVLGWKHFTRQTDRQTVMYLMGE